MRFKREKYFSMMSQHCIGGHVNTCLSAGAVRVTVEMLSEEEAEYINSEGGQWLWRVVTEFNGEEVMRGEKTNDLHTRVP